MKKFGTILIRVIIMAVCFVLTVILVDKFQNRQYKNLAQEMNSATLPLVYVDYEDRYINCLHGYTTTLDTTLLRDSITPVTADKKVKFAVDDANETAASYGYELRSISGDSLIENGELTPASEENGYKVLEVDIRMDIQADTEYMLVLLLTDADGQEIRYYTRVVVNDDYHAKELLEFVETFNDATFDFDANEEASFLYTYMQSYRSQANDSLEMGHLNLGSSYDELVWSGLSPVKITSIVPQIREIDTNYAVVELDYVVGAEHEDKGMDYFSVREIYRVSYKQTEQSTEDASAESAEQSTEDVSAGSAEQSTDGTIEVMNFDRYVDEYFNREDIDSKNNVYEIGVVPDGALDYSYSSDNKKIGFVRNGQLWLYDYSENQISMVFGFWLDDVENVRNTYNHYGINLISMDDDGNMTFAVYGYMNRGTHEGKMGISLCAYDAASLMVSELLFVECNEPYAAMEEEVSRLTYYDGTNFYFLLGNQVNCVNVEKKQASTYVGQVSADHVYVSDNMEVIAYDSSNTPSENRVLTLVNLKTGMTKSIDAGTGKCIICYGFKHTDLVYGVSDTSDADYTLNETSFAKEGLDDDVYERIPSYKLFIMDEDGNQIKEYQRDGDYIVDVTIEDNLIYMMRGTKSGSEYVLADDDFITFKEDDTVERIQTEVKTLSDGIGRLYFTVPSNIYLTYVPYLNITKTAVAETSVDMLLTVEDAYAGYMVYDNLGLAGIYETAGDAINQATKLSGIVVSKDGDVVYRQSEALAYNTIASSIYHQSSGSVEDSLWDCVYMTLVYEGVTDLTYEDMKSDYTDPMEALSALGKYPGADISGISLDLVVAYIGDGVPVISRIDDGRYVLIVSYNSEAIRYYDPVLDEEVRVSRTAFAASMETGGNEMYTFVTE